MGHLVEDVDLQFLGSLVLFLAPLRRALYPWYAGGGNELAIASIVTTTQLRLMSLRCTCAVGERLPWRV